MSDIKMSEMFPEAFQVDHNKSFEVQDATWYSYGEKYESDGDQDSAIEHAVLNHDRLKQENAELREFAEYCQGFLGCEETRDSMALHGVTIKAKQLLNKNDN